MNGNGKKLRQIVVDGSTRGYVEDTPHGRSMGERYIAISLAFGALEASMIPTDRIPIGAKRLDI